MHFSKDFATLETRCGSQQKRSSQQRTSQHSIFYFHLGLGDEDTLSWVNERLESRWIDFGGHLGAGPKAHNFVLFDFPSLSPILHPLPPLIKTEIDTNSPVF